MVQGHCAYWGATPSSSACWGWTGSVYLGPVPAVRDQWVMLVVKSTDIGLDGTWDGMVYGAAGGEVAWDVTTTQTVASWTDASLKVSGLSAVGTGSNNQIEVDYANNNTQIGIGPQSGDSASVLLYNRATGITAFPIQVKIRVFSYVGGIQEYYFSPLKNVWPGDSFRDVGSSSFFDSYVNNVAYWPSDSIHTALLGSRTFSGDCLGSILCYDMETMTETQTAVDTGAVTIQMLDLSGKGSHGTLGGVPIVTNADIGKAAAGLGTTFNVATSDETAFTMPTIDAVSGHWNTVSFWMYWTGTSGQIPFGFSGYNLYFASAYFGFNTANNGDIWGIDNTSLANTRVYVTAEFYNGDGKISKLYINGVQKTLTQKLGTTVSRTASTNAKLASWPSDGIHHFGGTIDQVQVFNRALTDTEILEQYYSRMPGGPQTYLRPQTNGLPVTSRVPYEGTYLYVAATYDSKGNVLSVTDAGRTISGGANITRYAYSTLYGRDYRTQVNRSDGKQIYTAYDFQSGVKYGTLSIDCRRSRTSYDTMGRPTQTSVYDTDANEVLHLDMETATYNSLKDVSCAGNNDSTRGQSVSLSGTTATTGIEGGARSFSGVTSDNIDVGTGVSVTGSATISFWVKPSNINTGCCGVNGQVVAYFQTGSTSDFFVIGYYNSGGTNGIVLASAQATVAASKQSTIPLDLNWHHIVVTKTAGAISSIYIDGVDRTTTAQTYWVGGYSKEVVGASYGGGALTAPLYGSLDEVRLFNVVRSTSEITNLWNFKYKLLTSSAAAYDDVFPTSVTTGVSASRSIFKLKS